MVSWLQVPFCTCCTAFILNSCCHLGNAFSQHCVQVEFDALNKVSTVDKKSVRVEGAQLGPSSGFGAGIPQMRTGGFGAAGAGGSQIGGSLQGSGFGFRSQQSTQGGGSQQFAGGYGTRTPMHHSMTPMHHFGSGGVHATPSHPSMTPLHAPYTPMHANTPMDDNYNHPTGGGSQQRGGGGGGGGYPADPHRGSGGGGGSHHHHQGSGGHMAAPTPGMHSGYTPAAYTPALTPAGYGGGDTAPTPGLGDMPGGSAYHGGWVALQ